MHFFPSSNKLLSFFIVIAWKIYWVQKILRQPRVPLRDSQARCNCIPLDDSSLFQLKKKDGQMSKFINITSTFGLLGVVILVCIALCFCFKLATSHFRKL